MVHHRRNQGKGAAIRTALTVSSGDYVHHPRRRPGVRSRRLSLASSRPSSPARRKLVYGVRSFAGQKPLLRWGNQFLTWVTNLLFRTRLHDMETCYKLLPGDLFRTLDLECHRFDMEPEITAKVLRRGYRIHEVPISYEPRGAKKLSPWRDGLPALWALLKYRWQKL